MQSTDLESYKKASGLSQDAVYASATLTPREALELFENAVDNARQGIQSLAGSTKASEVAKAKLTLDLKHCKLDRMPSEVVETIRHDVERYGDQPGYRSASSSDVLIRLQLAHNQLREIPIEFTNCLALRYLNLRDNRFVEMPRAVSSFLVQVRSVIENNTQRFLACHNWKSWISAETMSMLSPKRLGRCGHCEFLQYNTTRSRNYR